MEGPSLQFHGTHDTGLLAMVLAAVVIVLLGWGLFQLASRRWRLGALTLAAALGPATAVAAMIVDGLRSRAAGNAKSARASLVAAGLLVLAMAAATALVVGTKAAGSVWLALLAMEVILAVGVFYSSVYAYLGTGRIAALMALRCAAIACLMLVLFKPVVSLTGAQEARPYLEVLVDRSASMATVDESSLPDRYVQALQMLTSQAPRLGKHFRPVWRHFGASPQSADSLDQLAQLRPSGDNTGATNLATAIRTAAAEYPKGDQAGILLISDGIHNMPDSYLDAAIEAGVPVYTVGAGSTNEKSAGRKNLQLVSVEAPLEAVVNNIAPIKANVRITGYGDASVPVRLVDDAGGQMTRQVSTGANAAGQEVSFRWTPRDAASAPADAAAGRSGGNIRKLRLSIGPEPGEAVADDNEAEVHVLMTQPRIRVVYVEGTIRPEYRSLKRFLETDPNVEFMGLVRASGNTFWAQGSLAGRKLAALPTSDEDFKLFDVLILGDLDRTFLTDAQMTRIRKFVNDGGGLLMLGGHNSFGPGGYADTPVEQVLPVTVGNRQQPQEATPFVPQLTAAGQAHPVFDGIAGFFPGPAGQAAREDLPKLPELLGCVSVPSAKPAASVLAVHPSRRNETGPLPVLVVQPVGAGRSAAFTADTTRLWDVPMRALGADSPYQRFWGQLIRHLAGVETKARQSSSAVVLRMESNYAQAGDSVKLIARVQDAKGQAPASAQVTVTVSNPVQAGQKEEIPLSSNGRGLFEGVYRPRKEGKYQLAVTAADENKQPLGADELPLRVDQHLLEMDRLSRNNGSLMLIAEKSGGRYADLSAMPDLIDRIVERQKSHAPAAAPSENISLYNFTFLFLAFVGFLTVEWLLRRSWQLH